MRFVHNLKARCIALARVILGNSKDIYMFKIIERKRRHFGTFFADRTMRFVHNLKVRCIALARIILGNSKDIYMFKMIERKRQQFGTYNIFRSIIMRFFSMLFLDR